MFRYTALIIAIFSSACSNSDLASKSGVAAKKHSAGDAIKIVADAKRTSPATTKKIAYVAQSLGKNCSDSLPHSQKGSACWDYDIDGDGNLDRVRIAGVGEYSYVHAISELPEDGDTFLPDIRFKEEIIGLNLSSGSKEYAVNLAGAAQLYLVNLGNVRDFGPRVNDCLVAGENPIVLAKGRTENVVITYDDNILSARRCNK